MTLVALPGGFIYPANNHGGQLFRSGPTAGGTLDAATEKHALLGKVQMAGRTTSAKTISAAGGGSISFRTGTSTFADAATALDIGIQDISATAPTPDGTYDVKRTLTGGAGITSAAWNTVAMTGGTGTKTISHGDHIAIVFDMTARGGVDSVVIQAGGTGRYAGNSNQSQMPATADFTGGAWQQGNRDIPNVIITFDDGTLATLEGANFYSAGPTAEAYSNSTNPDERGIIFQAPFKCKVGAYTLSAKLDSITTADGTMELWSDPLGTPAVVAGSSLTLNAEAFAISPSFISAHILTLPTEIELQANTDYVLAWKATSTGNINLFASTLGDEAYRALLPGGTTVAKATRDNATGAFAAEIPAITRYTMGLLVTQIDDGTGAGGGGLKLAGRGGLAG